MILVSSCLCGSKCKYNGGDNFNQTVMDYCKGRDILQACPEVLGGLTIPRIPSEIVGGTAEEVLNGKAKVINQSGIDVTEAFIKGAYIALKKAQEMDINLAILKANSPSCGKGNVYSGLFNNQLILGNGITAELFIRNGIEVITEKELKEKLK